MHVSGVFPTLYKQLLAPVHFYTLKKSMRWPLLPFLSCVFHYNEPVLAFLSVCCVNASYNSRSLKSVQLCGSITVTQSQNKTRFAVVNYSCFPFFGGGLHACENAVDALSVRPSHIILIHAPHPPHTRTWTVSVYALNINLLFSIAIVA